MFSTLLNVALASLPVIWLLSLIWVYRDAETRGRNGLFVTAVVAVLWPFSLFGWSTVRPPKSKRCP